MPTLQAKHTLDRAKLILQDTTGIRWATPELLGWFNDGQREVVIILPSANALTVPHILVAGTKQSIPADGNQLIKVVRNMGGDGNMPGRVVRKVPEEQLDATLPDWHMATPAASTLHYCFDERVPKTFYVYPPAIASQRLEIAYSASPAELAAETDIQVLDDVYANALLDYVLYRAYSKDAESTANAARAVAHRQAFEGALGVKANAGSAIVARDEVRG